jgi:methionyl aminopeptidase
LIHSLPDNVLVKNGDILSIDFGCCVSGYYGDSAWTYPVGEISEQAKKLLKVTENSLNAAIRACFPGNRIGGISQAVQDVVDAAGFGIVREFVGHGIGEKMHEPPAVPNYGVKTQGRVLKAGMVLAIEPMITLGSYKVKILEDGWTASTLDDSLAAHFEHTVAVTNQGPVVLTNPNIS